MKSTYIALATCFRLTLRVLASTGMVWTLIPRYAPPLSKAACADAGTTLATDKDTVGIWMQEECVHIHFWFRDAFGSSRPVSMRLHRHNDGFCTARGCRSRTVRVIVHSQAHRHNFSLHLADRREGVGMKRVCHTIPLERRDNNRLHVVAAICIKVYKTETALLSMLEERGR